MQHANVLDRHYVSDHMRPARHAVSGTSPARSPGSGGGCGGGGGGSEGGRWAPSARDHCHVACAESTGAGAVSARRRNGLVSGGLPRGLPLFAGAIIVMGS